MANRIEAELDPRTLDVVDASAIRDPGDGVHQDDLPEGRTATGFLLEIDRAGHVHERQADELREPAGLLLECSSAKEVMNPVLRALNRPEHDRHIASEADGMGDAVGFEPFLGVDLVGAEGGTHIVVEDLGGSARQRLLAGLFQTGQVVGQRLLIAFGALGDFERGEAVDVHPRNRLVYRTGDIDVVVAVEVGVDTTLQAHLGGACLGGLDRAIAMSSSSSR